MKPGWHLPVTAIAGLFVFVALACGDSGGDNPDASPSMQVPLDDGGGPAEEAGSSNDSDVNRPTRTCTDEGWCRTVVPDGQTLRAVWSDGKGVAWTVSEQGNILRWDGTAWVQSHAAGVPLYTIWGSNPTDLWAGGGEQTSGDHVLPGVLLHGTGESPSTITWKTVPAPLTVRSIWGTSAEDVWAVTSLTHRIRPGDPSFVLHYSGPLASPDAVDAGAGWETDPISTEFPTHFEKVWGTSADDVWLVGRVAVDDYDAQGRTFHRRPDGKGGFSWRIDQPMPQNQPIRTWLGGSPITIDGVSVSRNHVFLVRFGDNYAGSYHAGISNDDGATFAWTQHPTSETGFIDRALTTVWGSGPDDIWMAGELGRLRHWDGIAWRVASVALDDGLPMQKPVNAISGSAAHDVWVVGADIALHKVAP